MTVKLVDIAEVVIGAGIGGGLRYVLGGWIAERWGVSFPWHTFAINISGAFLLGILMALTVERSLVPPSMRLFLGVCILGGFTTFSTLSYESVALVEQGLFVQGAANMFGSALLGMVAAVVGLFVGRAI
jgi:fluoride exporter